MLGASDPFKARHISQTQQDYATSSLALAKQITESNDLSSKAATTYATWVAAKLKEEEDRCQAIWQGSGPAAHQTDSESSSGVGNVQGIWEEVWKGVQKEIQRECVEKHLVEHAQRGALITTSPFSNETFAPLTPCIALDEAFHASDLPSVKQLYRLLTSVRKFTVFKNAFSTYIKVSSAGRSYDIWKFLDMPLDSHQAHSKEIISDPAKDATMVASLLNFKHILDSAVAAIYDFDPHAETAAMAPEMIVKEEKRRLVLENEIREGLKHGVETRG